MYRSTFFSGAVALALALPLCATRAQQPTPAPAAAPTTDTAMVAMRGSAVKWMPRDVPGFPRGMQIGVLAGDPAQAGPYTIRLKFPSGYAFPPHWHPTVENLTVISGRFFLGMGEKVNRAALKAYAPGDYILMPATMPHFGRVQGPTVVQLHGMGPFEIKLVEQTTSSSQR